mmetsp:Transcript_11256/g.22644  ORF Transcript_11256/g.22644 Transcript_11256/m.22644 type:complete len:1495 (+) Transcript_11256:293-4777(+)
MGIAACLCDLGHSGALTEEHIPIFFGFLFFDGMGDPDQEVRHLMTSSGLETINGDGRECLETVLPMIDLHLKRKDTSADPESLARSDRIRESLIVCLGNLVRHLPPKDERVISAARQVIQTARETPSEAVQRSASLSLVPLASGLRDEEQSLTDPLLLCVFGEKVSYGERKGASYCLAGYIRGAGFQGLKRLKIIDRLRTAFSEKKPFPRLGALVLLETLASRFGKLFEPFTIPFVPDLLTSMSDSNNDIRSSGWLAAQSMMAELSSQGVRLILRSLLNGLKERQWRTRAGSAEVLGAMAFCAPRQLAVCLPEVVPGLALALADVHPKVIESAEDALSRIAAVARNPEVRQLSAFLLAALKDPSDKTRGALDAVLATEFIHAVDAASLALLIQPVYRGLRERGSDVKMRAAEIVGSISAHMAHATDVLPYIELLLPELQKTLLDPSPDVRRTSASALGALSESLGPSNLHGLLEWLLGQLWSCTVGSAERNGSAAGLSEVVRSFDDEEFDEIFFKILEREKGIIGNPILVVAVKEGALMFLSYLPLASESRFADKLDLALPFVLRGLAHESDAVRDASLNAGRSLVNVYGKVNVLKLLPPLLDGLRGALWRIRENSLELVGDLILRIAGYSKPKPGTLGDSSMIARRKTEDGKDRSRAVDTKEATLERDRDAGSDNDDEIDDEDGDAEAFLGAEIVPEDTMKALVLAIGDDMRNELLAVLYLTRCDVAIRVRQSAVRVWKMIVSNTPRTLRDVIRKIMNEVTSALSQDSEDRRAAGARAIGDLAQKLGERVIPDVLPLLEHNLASSDPKLRRGSCEGLGELMLASTRTQLVEHSVSLVRCVQLALRDSSASVREAASEVYSGLVRTLGQHAGETVLVGLATPALEGAEDAAEDGLRRALEASGSRVIAVIVPRLLSEPLTIANAKAIAAAIQVAENSFDTFVPQLVESCNEALLGDSSSRPAVQVVFGALALSETLLGLLLSELFPLTTSLHQETRNVGIEMLEILCEVVVQLPENLLGKLFDCLIRCLSDCEPLVYEKSAVALRKLVASVGANTIGKDIPVIRQMLRAARAAARMNAEEEIDEDEIPIPGLCLPQAPAPLVSVYIEALLQGSAELREQAALAVAELADFTSRESLQPFVMKLTGALIRVVSDRFPWQVKAGILLALNRLLVRCGPAMKLFIPQLQSTFLKSLSDPTKTVRYRASVGLGELSLHQPRTDPTLNELCNIANSLEVTPGSRVSSLEAIEQVIRNAKTLSESSRASLGTRLLVVATDPVDVIRKAAAAAYAALLSRASSSAEIQGMLDATCSTSASDSSGEHETAGVSLLIRECCKTAGTLSNWNDLDFSHTQTLVVQLLASPSELTREIAVAAAAEVYVNTSDPSLLERIGALAIDDPSIEVRVAALKACGRTGEDDRFLAVIPLLIETLVSCARERNTGIKFASERSLRVLLMDVNGGERSGVGPIARKALSVESRTWLTSNWRRIHAATDTDAE